MMSDIIEADRLEESVTEGIGIPADESGGIQAFLVEPTAIEATGVAVLVSEEEEERVEKCSYVRKGIMFTCIATAIVVALAVPLMFVERPVSVEVSPTAIPTFTPSPMPTPITYADIIDVLFPVSGAAILEPGTPQFLALDWIAREGTANLPYSSSRFVQRYALAVIYFSTNGGNWIECSAGGACPFGSPWLGADDFCSWGGIFCSDDVNISTINLGRSTGNGLVGTLPSELSQIRTLNGLQIENNKISGTIPSELALIPSFFELVAGKNSLENPLPPELLSKSTMKILTLEENNFKGPLPDISSMTSLQMLSLFGNAFTGTIPSYYGTLDGLSLLYLSNNDLTGTIPYQLGDMPSLAEFLLQDNSLTGTLPAELLALGSLHTINVSDNFLSGKISNSIEFMGSDIRERKRRSIRLSKNQFSGTLPTGIGNVPDLTELLLDHNDFSGEMPESVCQLETSESTRTFKLRYLTSDCSSLDCTCSAACRCSVQS